MPETISKDELDTLSRSELNDELVLDIASRTFGVSTHQVILAALLANRGNAYGNHLDETYWNFWTMGRVPNDVRQYAIDCLLGRTVMITDEDGKEGLLLV